jgi:hypothetical protein
MSDGVRLAVRNLVFGSYRRGSRTSRVPGDLAPRRRLVLLRSADPGGGWETVGCVGVADRSEASEPRPYAQTVAGRTVSQHNARVWLHQVPRHAARLSRGGPSGDRIARAAPLRLIPPAHCY